MRAIVEFLKSQYLLGRLDDTTIDNAVSNSKITSEEANYIKRIE